MTEDNENNTTEPPDAPPINFRVYERRDAESVLQLNELAFRDSPTDPDDMPGIEDLQDVRGTYLESAGSFVAGTIPTASAAKKVPRVEDGALVAMGGFLPNETGYEDERAVSEAAELHRMRVAPQHRRCGYGQQLLQVLEDAIEDIGYTRVLATTARRQNPAVQFYNSEGFNKVGTSTNGEYELIHFEKKLQ